MTVSSNVSDLLQRSSRNGLADYDSAAFGPLFAVSDEGSAGQAVVDAAYGSAKARALGAIDPVTLGVVLDGERMTSAGEVPIGPDEYEVLNTVASGRLMLTTNVGVRANARLAQPLPEIDLPANGDPDAAWFEALYATFRPFMQTPDGKPRPLTVRLTVVPGAPLGSLATVARAFEQARGQQVAAADRHRLSVLIAFENEIETEAQIQQITAVIDAAAAAGIPEVAIDGELRQAARRRLGVQSLLNVVDVPELRRLMTAARVQKIRLTHRYQLDIESIARTIWTGLYATRTHGFAAGKYGLVPMTLPEQGDVIALITRWMRGWTAIPAFYVDTPLIDADNVFDVSQCAEAAAAWLRVAGSAGVRTVLFDSPDRITPRKLLRASDAPASDTGVLTLADIDALLGHARSLGVEILWSGGITSRQAFELALRRVHGIFSTSSTARRMAVTPQFERDARLPAENEPTEQGVRRIHALVQGGFLSASLPSAHHGHASAIEDTCKRVLDAEQDPTAAAPILAQLDAQLEAGWRLAYPSGVPSSVEPLEPPLPVPPDAVRVFRGKRRDGLKDEVFLTKLGTVFMPMTVQMQRLYGLTAYLPAVLPVTPPPGVPDEIALVFYRTQGAYHYAKECIGGRAYSDLHELVFDMPKSRSGFPLRFNGTLQSGQPCHLFDTAVDWQSGSVQVFVGTRKASVAADAFPAGVAEAARAIRQTPGAIDAAIVSLDQDCVVCWTHEPGSHAAPIHAFDALVDTVLAAAPRQLAVPSDLSRPYAGLQLSAQGDFLTMRFGRAAAARGEE